jgi:hypothetical protein
MEEEARGWPFDEGKMKGVGCQFGLAPSGCGRVAHDDAWRGGTDRRWEKTPGWAVVDRALGQCRKNPKENGNGLLTQSRLQCELVFRMDFRIDFRDFEFKSKGLNISKPNFELR